MRPLYAALAAPARVPMTAHKIFAYFGSFTIRTDALALPAKIAEARSPTVYASDRAPVPATGNPKKTIHRNWGRSIPATLPDTPKGTPLRDVAFRCSLPSEQH